MYAIKEIDCVSTSGYIYMERERKGEII